MCACYASSIFKQNHFSFFLVNICCNLLKKNHTIIERDILDYNIHNPDSKDFQRKHKCFSLLFPILFWFTSATFFRRLIIISWWVKGRESSFSDTPSTFISCPHRLSSYLPICLHSSFLPFFLSILARRLLRFRHLKILHLCFAALPSRPLLACEEKGTQWTGP